LKQVSFSLLWPPDLAPAWPQLLDRESTRVLTSLTAYLNLGGKNFLLYRDTLRRSPHPASHWDTCPSIRNTPSLATVKLPTLPSPALPFSLQYSVLLSCLWSILPTLSRGFLGCFYFLFSLKCASFLLFLDHFEFIWPMSLCWESPVSLNRKNEEKKGTWHLWLIYSGDKHINKRLII
jgi:hypothetical protein